MARIVVSDRHVEERARHKVADHGPALVRTEPPHDGAEDEAEEYVGPRPEAAGEHVGVVEHEDAVRKEGHKKRCGQHEMGYELLRLLAESPIPAPRLILLGAPDAEFAAPYSVIEYIDGEPGPPAQDRQHSIGRMASALANIHKVDALRAAAVVRRADDPLSECAETAGREPGARRRALRTAWPMRHAAGTALLHGDFWPGNTLWRDRNLMAVIDWEDAALGDPLQDVANARIEILSGLGADAVRECTDRYLAQVGPRDVRDLPVWDLHAALRIDSRLSGWGLGSERERHMRDLLDRFADDALRALRAGPDGA